MNFLISMRILIITNLYPPQVLEGMNDRSQICQTSSTSGAYRSGFDE
ncbi:MAG: hypothetical protein HC936_11510 [Leptolyngbyaceae cyanobacterium SU_3_3]|nr:hypothetical protein [Leptolyngbyaceae cyanobacterium SU_3_3]